MNWFRLYSEARNDAKLRSLNAEHFRVWFNLLCFAGEQPRRGVIAYEDLELLALEVANADVELLEAALARLVKLHILARSEGALSFLHWDDRQFDNPSDRPEAVRDRVARHRARQRAVTPVTTEPTASLEVDRDVTPSNDLSRNVTSNTQSRSRTEAAHARASSAYVSAAPAVKPPLPAGWTETFAAIFGEGRPTAGEVRQLTDWANAGPSPPPLPHLRFALERAKRKATTNVIRYASTVEYVPEPQPSRPARAQLTPDEQLAAIRDL